MTTTTRTNSTGPTILRRALAAAVVAAIAALGSVGVARAATNPAPPKVPKAATSPTDSWQQVHDKVAKALSDRQATLAQLTTSVAGNKYLTATDSQALQSLVGPETLGINQLAATVASATPQNTTIAQLRQDAKTMVDQYRVYLVMAPQVHFTEAADTQTDLELKLAGLEPKIQAAIAKAGNPADAIQAYNDLVTQVAHAATATGQANVPAVLHVTPAGYPADGTPLTMARATLHTAENDLKSARTDIQIIRNALQQGKGGATTSSSAA